MNRALLAAVILVTACVGRKLPEVEKDLAAAALEEAAAQKEVAKASAELADATRAQDAEQAKLTRGARSLASYQSEVVRKWDSDPKKLAALKKAHPMPAPLLAALEAAQTSGGNSTPEKRFEASLADGKLTDAAAVLEAWEASDYPYGEDEPEAECRQPEVPALKCRPNAKLGILLCDGADNTWLLWAEQGALVTRSGPSTGLEVIDRPAPGVWLLKKGAERNLYESQEGNVLLRWVASLPAEHAGKKAQLTWKNLDSDPFPEGVYESEGAVRFLDLESTHGVTAYSELDSCHRLAALGALPDSAKAGCATREAAAAAPADAGR